MVKIQTSNELKKFLIFLLLGFFILLLDQFQVLSPIKSYSERLFLPSKKTIYRNWQKVKSEINERTKLRNCSQTKELEEKIISLEQKVAQLATRNSQLATENQAAQRLLGTPLPPDWQFIPAQTAELVNGILTIDKGKADGVKVGQAVLVENIWVGKVKRVEEYQSWVELPINKNSKLLAKIIPNRGLANTETLNPAESAGHKDTENIKAKGLLVGDGDKISLEKVLQAEQLTEGDLVVTGEFPPNLVIGKIKKVIKKDVEIYQTAEVEPLVNYKKLEVVFLLR